MLFLMAVLIGGNGLDGVARAGQSAGIEPKAVSKEMQCPVCGMYPHKFPKWQSQVVFADGTHNAFESYKDLFKYLLDMGSYETAYTSSDVAAVFARDFNDGEWLKIETAHFVAGSNEMGPMGIDLIPFKDVDHATKFAKDHGGKVVTYHQVDMDLILSLKIKSMGDMHKHKKE